MAVYAIVLVRTAWVSDDAFITMRCIDNAVNGYGLRWNVAERVQAFTHPLWAALLAVPYAVTRAPYGTVLGVGMAVSIAVVGLLAFRYRADPIVATASVALLVLSKSFVDFSTSGLENPLTHLLVLGLAAVVLGAPPWSRRRIALAALAGGLIALTRPDATLLAVPAIVWGLAARRTARDAAAVAAALTPWLAWEAFSLVYYGSLVPNTALAKLHTGLPAGELAVQGLRYLGDAIRRDPITPVAIVAALVAAARRRRPAELALAVGIVLHLGYVVSIGGDFMAGRFLTPALVLSVILLAEARFFASGRMPALALAAIAALGLPFAGSTILSGADYGDRAPTAVASSGVSDERGFYFAYSGLLNGRPRAGHPSEALSFVGAGLDLRAARAPLGILPAIGFAGFLAGPSVHVVDRLALADPFLARLPMVRRAPPPFDGGTRGWRIGHFERAIPAGYLATLATGRNRLRDPGLARLWNDVALATRAPLLERGRLAAIVRLLLRTGPDLPRPAYHPPDWSEVLAVEPDNLEALYQDAMGRLARGDQDGAQRELDAVVGTCPGHGAAAVALARLDLSQGRVEPAARVVDRFLALRPDDATALVLRGRIDRRRGDPDAAESAFLAAGRLAPNVLPAAYTDAAMIRAMRGDLDGALRLLDRVARVAPAYEPARRVRAAVLARKR